MDLFVTLDLAGTAIFAISGALRGIERRLDLFGIAVVALLTAIGGGTIRDLLIGERPFFLEESWYVAVALAMVPLAIVLRRALRDQRGLVYLDALGLGVFSAVGALKGIEVGLDPTGVVVTGLLTGVGGGIVRDLLVREIPFVLVTEIYATASLAGIGVLLALHEWAGASDGFAAAACIVTVGVLRAAAYARGWRLPTFGMRERPPT